MHEQILLSDFTRKERLVPEIEGMIVIIEDEDIGSVELGFDKLLQSHEGTYLTIYEFFKSGFGSNFQIIEVSYSQAWDEK